MFQFILQFYFTQYTLVKSLYLHYINYVCMEMYIDCIYWAVIPISIIIIEFTIQL